jgi:uncharacterized protein YcsI (UPF0317 family)
MSFGMSPLEFRKSVRSGKYQGNTSGYCPGYVQGNVVILPSDWAAEFLQFCQFNQKPCPLVAMSEIGDPSLPTLGKELDIRTDLSLYRIFKDGNIVEELPDITNCWRDDFVTFVLGCSFSFEEALMADGLEVRNIMEGVNVPMYRTDIPCRSAGRFNGNMVVSMRPFLAADAIRAVQISTRFPSVHGAPVHLGDPARIGIQDISNPDFGDAVTMAEGEIPVFWACGVTPQVALEQAKPPVCITHSPGCMLVTDLRNSQLAVL